MSYKPSSHPGAQFNVIRHHRMDVIQRAALFIRLQGDCVSNRELSDHLAVPARGLRQIMERSGLFIVEIRGDGARCQPWYRIRPDAVQAPRGDSDLPALRQRISPSGTLQAIGYDCGPVSETPKSDTL